MAFFKKNSGRILRIRPGHLANFSGGAGYMPFIVIFSVPASALFALASSLILFLYGKNLLPDKSSDGPILGLGNGPKTSLHSFVLYAFMHIIVCICLAVAAGIFLFNHANSMIYGDKAQYALAAATFALGPLVAWLLSTVVLALLMIRYGAKWTIFFITAGIYVVLLIVCFFLGTLTL
ncbi:MAG: hypothetical protein PVH19_05060 [Planctomycetia bacterium]|jgi:hypothetical protein